MSAPFYTFGPIGDEHRDGKPRLVRTADGHLNSAFWRDGGWYFATDPRFPRNPLDSEPIEVAK